MSNKTTAILTFIVSTVIPFIQEIVDFISMFRTGSYDKSGSSALSSLAAAVQSDLQNCSAQQESEVTVRPTSFRHSTDQGTQEKPYSRFLGKAN